MTGNPHFYYCRVHAPILTMLIERRGLNPTKLARQVHVDRRHVYRLLNGERDMTTYPTAQAIANALDVDIELFADPSPRWVGVDRRPRTQAM